MKHKNIWIVMLVCVLLGLLACRASVAGIEIGDIGGIRGSGDLVEEFRAVAPFSELQLTGFGKVIFNIGDQYTLRIEAEDNILEYLTTEVIGQRLIIGNQDGVHLNPTRTVYYYLTAPGLNAVWVTGSGEIKLPDIKSERFEIQISGSGDVNIETLLSRTLDVGISGSGNVLIADGKLDRQFVTISGSGGYKAEDMVSEAATITISGSGNATCWASDTLTVKISGSGEARYFGNPAVSFSGSGSGNLTSLGDR